MLRCLVGCTIDYVKQNLCTVSYKRDFLTIILTLLILPVNGGQTGFSLDILKIVENF